MVLSMVMAVWFIRFGEESNGASKVWIVLSCLSVLTVMGIGYTMLGGQKTETTAPESASVERETTQVKQQPPAVPQPGSNSTVEKPPAETPGMTKTPENYQYLQDILEALKRGEAVPQEYLDLLPEKDRQKIQNSR